MPRPNTDNRAVRQDGTSAYADNESFKTGSESKRQRQEALIEWLLTPEKEREPSTKTAFAKLWGVSTQTLRNDTREPQVQRELATKARAVAKVERLPEIMDALYRITQGKNADGSTKYDRFGQEVFPSPGATVSAANTILNWMEQTRNIREGGGEVSELSDEQLVEAALQLLNKTSDSEAT